MVRAPWLGARMLFGLWVWWGLTPGARFSFVAVVRLGVPQQNEHRCHRSSTHHLTNYPMGVTTGVPPLDRCFLLGDICAPPSYCKAPGGIILRASPVARQTPIHTFSTTVSKPALTNKNSTFRMARKSSKSHSCVFGAPSLSRSLGHWDAVLASQHYHNT